MKNNINYLCSYDEIENLGEQLLIDYYKKIKRKMGLCIDIEGFVKKYLKSDIIVVPFAEKDPNRIGFLSNGEYALSVREGSEIVKIIFPKNAIVIDSYVDNEENFAVKRFTIAHECAHFVLIKHLPCQTEPCFRTSVDIEYKYSIEEIKELYSFGEMFANRLAAVLLMPFDNVIKALELYNAGKRIKVYGDCILAECEKLNMNAMSNAMGVSHSALFYRLKELDLLDYHPGNEYLNEHLGLGGNVNA